MRQDPWAGHNEDVLFSGGFAPAPSATRWFVYGILITVAVIIGVAFAL